MAEIRLLAWVCCVILVSTNVAQVFSDVVPGIGVNWGTITSHPLKPSVVVNMLKDNSITRVKLFDSDSWTVSALAGSGIEVMLGIPNNQLDYLSRRLSNAKYWVKENVTKHLYNGGVNIKYVGVGNEPFLKSYNGTFNNLAFRALQNIQKALNEEGIGDKIKATIPVNADVYNSPSDKPSDGDFRQDVKDLMLQVVKFLYDNNSPFVSNIYPFLSLYDNPNFPIDFAFFDGGGDPITDGSITYTNVFDANYDMLVSTLKKAGVPDMKIIVGEIGWPTDGNINANVNLAQKFYNGFLKKLASNKGTPLHPGKLDVFLFSLVDEDQKSVLPGDFERHWGIFRYDGQPKFPMDISGKGNNKMLIPAKGVQYFPMRWCVYDPSVKKKNLIPNEISYACSRSDCTSLGYRSSCNNLDFQGNVSYAFNMYYQMNDQDVEACNFDGLAKIVTHNVSSGDCLFPVQIVSASERLKLAYAASVVAGFVLAIFT